MSAAAIAAETRVALTNVVGGTPVPEHAVPATKLVPSTVSVNAAPPRGAMGLSAVTVGGGRGRARPAHWATASPPRS